jgi:hypothetical protein
VALTFRDGKVTVSVDGDLERLARVAVDQALPGVREVMLREVKTIWAEALDEWPVETGKSRRGLKVVDEIDIGRSAYVVRIIADANHNAPYTIYVKPAKWHGATTAWQRLIRGPMFVLHRELAEDIGAAIVAGVGASLKGGA